MNNIISYHLVDHCNLNCSGCNHFSPLAQKRFADIDKFEKNLLRLNSLINITELNLMGGEPLLHPQINDFIKIARKYLPSTKIDIKTNGILLNKMQDSFYESCIKYDINLYITNYLNKNFYRLKNINCDIIDKDKFYFNYISKTKNNNTKCNNPGFNNYYNCCSQLNENGDFHFCGYSANIHFYNEYYKYDIPVIKDKDYFNIYETNLSFIDIIKLYYSKRPFCSYCTNHILGDWHKFNNIDEWKE